MLSNTYINATFDQLPPERKIDVLYRALDFMKEDNERFPSECLTLALGIPLFPKVKKILARDAYRLTLLFANGEERCVDFRELLDPQRRYDQVLLADIEQFNKVQVEEETLVWKEVGYWSEGLDDQQEFRSYDIDPALLYEAGESVSVKVS